MFKKKTPGRPKKDNFECKSAILGVRDAPNSDNNMIEFIFDDPKLFKKCNIILKNYYVDEIYIKFNSDNILLLAQDHTKKVNIKIKINCNNITEYYCRTPIDICIKRDHLDKIFSTIEKLHNRIIMYSECDSYQSILYINLLNEELGIHDSYSVDLLMKSCIEEFNNDIPEDDLYKIQFKISSKIFKKFINDSSNYCKILKIDKYYSLPLCFKMVYNNKVQFIRKFLDSDYFQLKSTLEENEYFNISVELDYIKPFSNTILSDYFIVYLDANHGIMLESVYNNICFVNIYTGIYKHLC